MEQQTSGGGNTCYILFYGRAKLRWLHMRDHYPSPLIHMEASMTLIVIPYVDDVLIFFGNMIGVKAHWLDVSMGNEISHTFYASCFKGSMGDGISTTVDCLFKIGRAHV